MGSVVAVGEAGGAEAAGLAVVVGVEAAAVAASAAVEVFPGAEGQADHGNDSWPITSQHRRSTREGSNRQGRAPDFG